MTSPSSDTAPPQSAGSGFPVVLFSVIMGGAMILLFGVLLGECRAGRDALEAYVSAIRGGASVAEAVGGTESEALTAVLGRSTGLTIANFQAQSGTHCYTTRLAQPEGRAVAVDFVLHERGAALVVSAASLQRRCSCPDDADQPCSLQP